MTTVSFITKKCAVCGKDSRQAEIGMRGMTEPYDLDTRPTGAARSSIYMWIQCCGACGYCAPDISQPTSQAQQTLQGAAYRRQIINRSQPEAMNHFLCHSLLQEGAGEFAQAGWAALHAAWVCDDDPHVRDCAAECRRRAFELFNRGQSKKQQFGASADEEALIRADLLRRSTLFEEARQLCEKCLEKSVTPRTRHLLAYELDLIEERDAGVHTLQEALEDTD